VEEAKAALKLYGKSLDSTRQVIDQLAAKDVSREDVQQFFLECYTKEFGDIPVTPTTKVEQNAKNRAMDACNAVFANFDEGRDLAGPTAWNLLNSVTQWSQHQRKTRIKDPVKVVERKMESQLFGVEANRAYDALQRALAL